MADEALARVGKGDPITADWANAVADAINARGASDPNANGTATPYGIMTPADVETMMRAPDAQAMPFDAAIIREGSDGDALYMALPNAPDYVFLGADTLAPSPAQTLGNATNAWVRIESVTNGTSRYVTLAVTKRESNPPAPPYWRLFVASSPTSRPSWADPEQPVVLLAGYNIAADDASGTDTEAGDVPSLLKGLVQYHRGTVNLPDGNEPCHPAYSLDEQAGSGCTEKTIVLKRTPYSRGSGGECEPGTPVIVGGGVAIPKPPEYTLSVAGSGCSRTVTLQRTPCGGQTAPSGDTLTITEPPTISATSGSSAPGAVAGTVTVTPCGGSATTIEIRNGNAGALPSGSFEVVGDIYVSGGYLIKRLDTYAFNAAGQLVFVSFREENLFAIHTCGT